MRISAIEGGYGSDVLEAFEDAKWNARRCRKSGKLGLIADAASVIEVAEVPAGSPTEFARSKLAGGYPDRNSDVWHGAHVAEDYWIFYGWGDWNVDAVREAMEGTGYDHAAAIAEAERLVDMADEPSLAQR